MRVQISQIHKLSHLEMLFFELPEKVRSTDNMLIHVKPVTILLNGMMLHVSLLTETLTST